MAREVVLEQVNAVLIAGDGWHPVQVGSYEVDEDSETFSFVVGNSLSNSSLQGSVVVGRASAIQAVRLVQGS